MLRTVVHLALHAIMPVAVAWRVDAESARRNAIIMLATMVVDLDHLLATPVFDPRRCSIGFHPLHSYWAIALYCALFWVRPLRMVALGLLIHMLLDGVDCIWMSLE